MDDLARFLRAAADEGRLRTLRLLLRADALNVGELVRILGLSQSSVSQKLGELKRAKLAAERRERGFAWYEAVKSPGDPSFDFLPGALARAPDPEGDLARLAEVLRERSDRGQGSDRLVEPGRSWVAWSRALRYLVPALKVADFGCGDGALTVEIAGFASAVTAIEKSQAQLNRARDRARRAGLANVTFLHQAIEELTLRGGSQDLVVVSHTLHHVEDPLVVMRQAARVLGKGGRTLVLELAPHGEAWVKEKLGHTHLGFTPQALEKTLGEAGFSAIKVEQAAKAAAEPFRVLVATGVKNA